MKVGVIVVLKNTSSARNKILEAEKHLFKVTKNDKQNLWLQSLDTLFTITIAHEFVRLATYKEKYLRAGNSVVINGKGYLVTKNILVGEKSGFFIPYINDDLTHSYGNIDQVFISESGCFADCIDITKADKILWDRNNEI